jgi:hypothetical protein
MSTSPKDAAPGNPIRKVMAFQLRLVGGQHGNGHGIFLYDLEQAPEIAAADPSHGD